MTPGLNIYQEERPWGNFRKFTDNTPSTVKILTIKAGESLSLQSHNNRSEFWKIVMGTGIAEIDGTVYRAKPGDEYMIPLGTKHRLTAESELEVMEIAFGEFSEEDVIHYEDKYGRA